jgi:hypothetical protein
MKKLNKEIGEALTWFFCGAAFVYLLVVLGFIFNVISININKL